VMAGVAVADHRDPELPVLGIVDKTGEIKSTNDLNLGMDRAPVENKSTVPYARWNILLTANIVLFVVFVLAWFWGWRCKNSRPGK
jgi:hypothetical protein